MQGLEFAYLMMPLEAATSNDKQSPKVDASRYSTDHRHELRRRELERD